MSDTTEEWRPVSGWYAYEVSNIGRVRRLGGTAKTIRTRILNPNGSSPYLQVTLCIENIRRYAYVHHLVAEAFIGPRPDGCEINHIDTNRRNNRWDNLEYLTDREHKRHSIANGLVRSGASHPMRQRPDLIRRGSELPWAKLAESDIPEIRRMISDGTSNIAIAKRFEVTPSLISCIKRGKAWAHVP